MTTTKQKPSSVPAALNVYKKVAIIRNSDDVLTYEDIGGTLKTVTDLHLAAVATTHLHKPKPKDNIPVPEIEAVETYERDILPNYGCPKSYVRFNRLSHEELRETLEYVIDAEDEAWLKNNTKFGSAAVVVVAEETTDRDRLKSLHDKQKIRILVDTNKMAPKSSIEENESTDPSPLHNTLHNENNDNNNNSNNNNNSIVASDVELQRKVVRSLPKTTILPIAMLEIMLDVLEKATAFDAIISLDQAEMLILRKLPQFYHMYAVRAKAGKVTIRHVMSDVYQYWVSKRSKLKRPLIRRF